MISRLLSLSVLALAAPLGSVHAAAYIFTGLGLPGTVPNASTASANGINDRGQIVGSYSSGTSNFGFIFDPATSSFTSFDYPTASSTSALAINNQDQVLGYAMSGSNFIAFLRDAATGAYTVLPAPGYGRFPSFSGINDAGQVIGQIMTGSNAFAGSSGVLRDPATGAYTYPSDPATATFYFPGYTTPYDINNRGQAAGYLLTRTPSSSTQSAFVADLASNTYTPFTAPGATETYAYALNDVGQVVGVDYVGGVANAFLLDLANGLYSDLNVPGATSTRPTGISNAGQIVGSYVDSTGTHAFLAKPITVASVPEPASLALLGGSFAALAWARRRQASNPA